MQLTTRLAPRLVLGLALGALLFAAPLLRAEGPPPFECPLCGGNVEAHKTRVAELAWFNGRAVTAVVTGLFQGR